MKRGDEGMGKEARGGIRRGEGRGEIKEIGMLRI